MKAISIFFLFFSYSTFAARFVVEVNQAFQPKEKLKIESLFISKNKKLEKYKVISGEISKTEIENIPGVVQVESPLELTHLSLRPGKNLLPFVKDELFSYQWGLVNQGQVYLKEKDDIHNIPISGKAGFDIGGESLLDSSLGSSKKIIVAVLDSGVDLNHEELKNNLWKNPNECGKDSNNDNDGNKLAGDCHGWNFTEAIDSDEAKNPIDLDGHGTHVAGIIAAEKNDKGIVGVFPHALILPIKVLKNSNSTSEISSSEAFARGIVYAVDQGAQVINLSLGWPRTLETKFLREAVTYALSQGVILVAAAGNNNSNEPLYPCAYEGVVCVGASTLNGEIARFSNYGSHVDTVAPGEGILSLHPTFFEPDLFSVPGFEIRSGTSQAAPFVSGLIAKLVYENSNLTIDDVFAKMYQSKKINSEKFFLGGMAHIEELRKDVSTPVIRPILKRVRQILINERSGKFKIPFRNFGTESSEIHIKLSSRSPGISFLQTDFNLPSLSKGQGIEIEVPISVNDMKEDHELTFEIEIISSLETLRITHTLPVLRDLRTVDEVQTFDFQFTKEKLPLGGIKNGQLVSFLNTVQTLGEDRSHEFFLRRILRDSETKDLELTLFRKEDTTFKQASRYILVPFGVNLVNFYKLDLNFDGKSDYFLEVLCEKEGQKYFSFVYLNSDLEPLFKNYPEFQLKLDLFVENLNEVSFIQLSDSDLGRILVPAFLTTGEIPLKDQKLSVWEKPDKSRRARFYFLERFKSNFELRSPTNLIWEEKIRIDYKLNWKDTIVVESLLPQSNHDLKGGLVRILFSYGKGSRRNFVISKFNHIETKRGNLLSQLVFQTEGIRPLFQLQNQQFEKDGEVYFNIYDSQRSKLIFTSDALQIAETSFTNEKTDDVLINHLASFKSKDSLTSIIESREELIWLNQGSNEFEARRSKLRYSFLSQKMLSEIYLPVTVKEENELKPALYLDMTPITGNRLLLLSEVNQKFISTIKNAFSVPSQCRPLQPVYSELESAHQFVFLCVEQEDFFIKTLTMENSI